MSKIYKISNSSTGEELLLVSKEYVDLRLKAIRDAINNHVKNIDIAHTKEDEQRYADAISAILDNVEYDDISDINEIDVSDATQIRQDTNHRFVTDAQLKSLNSKASLFEVQALINDAKNELQAVFNDQYIRLLNNQNAVEKLREISELLKDDINIDTILKALQSKINKEDLEEHAKMHTHISSEDREALNILMDKYESGDLESIGVKSIHADVAKTAMNALSLDNLNLDELRKARREDIIIGISNDYNKNELDIVVDTECEFGNLFNTTNGIVLFKNGVYKTNLHCDKRNNKSKELFIEGCGNGTVFELDECIIDNHVVISNCTIRNRSLDKLIINIGSNVRFNNVKFENCELQLKDSEFVSIRDCYLYNSDIRYNGLNAYIKIVDNYLDNSKINKYISKYIVVRDNVDIQ